jgi:hypothetical protein
MTKKRKDLCPACGYALEPISNYFNAVLDGIGARNSSFTDVDAVSHDGKSGRWLFQEFKGESEVLSFGQEWCVKAFTEHERFTAWVVRKREDGRIGWVEYRDGATACEELISVPEYQRRFRAWWEAP